MAKKSSAFKCVWSLVNLVGGFTTLYLMVIRPWHLKWGATADEVNRSLPGDDLIPNAKINATHAVTINAQIDRVWPWIAQIGQERGGFYSYEFIENAMGLDIHNADRIMPDFQHPQVGEKMPFAEGFGVPYAIVDAPRSLVIHGDTRTGTVEMPGLRPDDYTALIWGWHLAALDDHTTRLVERWQADYRPGLINTLLYRLFMEPGAFIMQRKMLLGIKERAEKTVATGEIHDAPDSVAID